MKTLSEYPETNSVAESCRESCEIPFQVIHDSSSPMLLVPLTNGLCLPKGAVYQPGRWDVTGLHTDPVAAQVEVLNRWPDGSVRWLLMHCIAPEVPPGRTLCTLVCRDDSTSLAKPHTDPDGAATDIRGSTDHVDISAELFDDRQHPLPLKTLSLERKSTGSVRNVSVQRLEISGLPCLELQLRIESWPTIGLLKVDTRLRNTRRARHQGGLWDLGDAGSFLFRGLHLHCRRTDLQPSTIHWVAEPGQSVQHVNANDAVGIVQHGSGGNAWNNTNHVAADGTSTVRKQGYEVNSPTGITGGLRSEPILQLAHEDKSLTVAVPEFWQQFPGSVASTDNRITVGLFPIAVEQTFELQGGEQKTQTVWVSTNSSVDAFDHLRFCNRPPRIVQPPQWVADCHVLSWFPSTINEHADDPRILRFRSFLNEATSRTHSVDARREKTDEYGWRNFGDVPADHEQTHYPGTNTIISHYNNQFDMIYGGLLNLIAAGDSQWFNLFDPLARHVMDVDIYHTQEDRACFNGGLFWHTDHYADACTATHRTYSRHNANGRDYGGGLSCEHNYTSGLLFYHFLTGHPDARDSVISLADWVIAMDDGSRTIFGFLDSEPTGQASSTVFEDFQGPGRGPGNSINALIDAWTLTGNDAYLFKAEELIRRVMHPDQDCDALHLADAEGHWSYTVCMTAVGRYLAVKLDAGQLDDTYQYARESLAHYGRWMAHHEQPALSQPEKLEYPTEAWAAQEFRKANALRIAACCTDNADEERQMRHKADELNDTAWRDLYRFDQQHLTARCLSILMTEGLREIFHCTCPPQYFPSAGTVLPNTEWTMFVPQKARVKQLLKSPARLVRAALKGFTPKRLRNTIDALKRRR